MKFKTLQTITKSEFNKLDNYAKRVLIAQDVLDRLEAKRFVENRGDYFAFRTYENGLDDAKTFINKNVCHVCAKGAAICSFVGKFNSQNISQLRPHDPELEEIFGLELWRTIERVFEGWDADVTSSEICDEYFGRKKWPMKKIMENIVRNNGKLKLVFKKSKENEYQKTIWIG